jgi:hypothetical protein
MEYKYINNHIIIPKHIIYIDKFDNGIYNVSILQLAHKVNEKNKLRVIRCANMN